MTLAEVIKQAEDHAIREALETMQGNVTAAARLLAISRVSLYRKMRAQGLISAQVVTDYRPHAASVLRKWREGMTCDRCGRSVYGQGQLTMHQRRCQV